MCVFLNNAHHTGNYTILILMYMYFPWKRLLQLKEEIQNFAIYVTLIKQKCNLKASVLFEKVRYIIIILYT